MSVFTAPAATTDTLAAACGGDGMAGALNALDDGLALKATLASPTFTGTVVIPTPFTIGAVSMTATGTELNFLDGVTTPTGSGALVLATTPTLVTPVLGVATATTINKVTITAPATASTLTVAQGSSLITAGAYAITLTSTATTGVTLPTTGTLSAIAGTETLTNKRITQRVVTTTDDATAVIDVDVTDLYELSAVANATEFTLTGTPTDGQKLIVRIKDAGVTKGLTWTGFTEIGVTLPTDTTASKWHVVGCIYNLAATQWQAVAVVEEA